MTPGAAPRSDADRAHLGAGADLDAGGARRALERAASAAAPPRTEPRAASGSSRLAVVPGDHGPAKVPAIAAGASAALHESAREELVQPVGDAHRRHAQQLRDVRAAELRSGEAALASVGSEPLPALPMRATSGGLVDERLDDAARASR